MPPQAADELRIPWTEVRTGLVDFVARRVEHRDAAEDIVQDVLERFQRAGSDSVQNPQAWLYRTARNAVIDHYRMRRNHGSLDEIMEAIDLPDQPSEANQPNEATRELAACLRPMVAQLPEKYRTALTLVDLDGHTQAQAAEAENLSVSGMKSRVQRGRTQLSELVTECCTIITDTSGAIADYRSNHPPDRGCKC